MTKKDEDQSNQIFIEAKDKQDEKKQMASLSIDSALSAASTNKTINKTIKADVNDVFKAIQATSKEVVDGDLSSLEKMLTGQVYSLQSIFNYATDKAVGAGYLSQFQAYSKLALKAQNQCRNTVATLASMKTPKNTTFIKNQATNQQVNFNSEKNRANELLSEEQNATMDTSRTTTPSPTDKEVEAVEV
jgi:hypothetical protein